jgi:peptidoglycan/xylan/chitin deacetylase (PgdA/CDA1 family)
MEKRIALRFDVDSNSCVTNGLPALVGLADRYSIPMTFFVAMGKAILRKNALLNFIRGVFPHIACEARDARAPNAVKRLGLSEALKTFILNPDIGITHAGEFTALLEKKHELGLHGGKNHAWWQVYAAAAGTGAVREDLSWGYDAFTRYFGKPAGFAAPGFAWSETTLSCIDEKGFLYASDMEGESPFRPLVGGRRFAHWQIPVTVQGPSHISVVEWACMHKQSEQDFIAELDLKLKAVAPASPAVLYGHPCFEGTKGLAYLDTAVGYLLDRGYSFVRMKDLVPKTAESFFSATRMGVKG